MAKPLSNLESDQTSSSSSCINNESGILSTLSSLFNFSSPIQEEFQIQQDQDLKDKFLEQARSSPIEKFDHTSGISRLREIWDSVGSDESRFELRFISNVVSTAGVLGFTYGSIIDSTTIFQKLVLEHNTNVFNGKHQANRQVSDRMYIEFFTRGFKGAFRFGLFSGLFVGPVILASTYHDELRISNGALSGALSGAVWKAQLGPRAILTNMILGSIFGSIFVGIAKTIFAITGVTYREYRLYDYALINDRITKKKIWENSQGPSFDP